MTDLKSCYNRQLAQVGSIIKELVGIERKLLTFITKLLPRIKHHICIAYRASQEYYGEDSDKIASTRQGYIALSNIFKDSSCFSC